MTREQILQILDQATQPGAKLIRTDFVMIQRALEETAKLFKRLGELEAQASEVVADKTE